MCYYHNDESAEIPNYHLVFCPLGFIPTTVSVPITSYPSWTIDQNCGTLPDLSLPPANPLISSLPPLLQQDGTKYHAVIIVTIIVITIIFTIIVTTIIVIIIFRTSPRQPELFVFLDRIRTRSWFMPDSRFQSPLQSLALTCLQVFDATYICLHQILLAMCLQVRSFLIINAI